MRLKARQFADYFRESSMEECATAVAVLLNSRPKRYMTKSGFTEAVLAVSGYGLWLFEECVKAAGDRAEAAALVLPDREPSTTERLDLAWWLDRRIASLAKQPAAVQSEILRSSWELLNAEERFVYNRFVLGSFRPTISRSAIIEAVAIMAGIPNFVVQARFALLNELSPSSFQGLLGSDISDTVHSAPLDLFPISDTQRRVGTIDVLSGKRFEWKRRGLRAQIVRRGGQGFVWTTAGVLVTDLVPEIAKSLPFIPDGVVIEGEIVCPSEGAPPYMTLALAFSGVDALDPKVPLQFVAMDLLEHHGNSVRHEVLSTRFALLNEVVTDVNITQANSITGDVELGQGAICISQSISIRDQAELQQACLHARALGHIGLLARDLDAPYPDSNQDPDWLIIKPDTMSLNGVLMYAERGAGAEASRYTQFTFGVWKDEQLVPIAKVASPWTDDEYKSVEVFIRENTVERFGPVRTVLPAIVVRIVFEGIDSAPKRKAGVILRAPAIDGIQPDLTPDRASTLEDVLSMRSEVAT